MTHAFRGINVEATSARLPLNRFFAHHREYVNMNVPLTHPNHLILQINRIETHVENMKSYKLYTHNGWRVYRSRCIRHLEAKQRMFRSIIFIFVYGSTVVWVCWVFLLRSDDRSAGRARRGEYIATRCVNKHVSMHSDCEWWFCQNGIRSTANESKEGEWKKMYVLRAL